MTHDDLFQDIPIGMAQVSLEGRLMNTNKRFCEIVGYSNTQLAKMTFQQITHADDLATDLAHINALLDRGSGSYHMEKRYICADGSETWVDLNVSLLLDRASRPSMFLATVSAIDEAKKRESSLCDLAYVDDVTGIPNRNYFKHALDDAIAQARSQGHKVALVFLDLNRFKAINDTHGHQVGDAVLRTIGKRLFALRTPDMLPARLSGDEFVCLLTDVPGAQTLTDTLDRLRGAFERPVTVGELSLPITASIGRAVFPDHARTAEALMRFADLAMYDDKPKAESSRRNASGRRASRTRPAKA